MALYSTRDAPDIEEWAAKSAAYHGGAGIAARLFSAIRNSMTALITSTAATKNKEALQSCRNNYERLSLWGQDLLVGDGDLDQVLYQAKELRAQVLSVLSRLGTIVLEAIYLGSGALSQVSKEQCNDLQDVLDTVDTMLKDTSVEERTMIPSSPTSESTSPDLDIADLLEEISDYVDCLLDLSSALDNPALDIERDIPEDPPARIRESFEVSSEEAMIYCRKIKDRFENLPKYLVERLAEANVSRATTVREKRAQPVKEPDIHEDAITERLFTTSNPHPSNTTKSTTSGPSVFSSIQSQVKLSSQRPTQLIDDETRSEATFASFSTAASALRHGRPRVPLMPEIQGDVFDCPICSSPISDVRNRQQWKKHVFDDIQPYLCTIKDCPDMILYSSSEEWAHHEKLHTSSSTSHSVECAFCSANYLTEGPSYYKHVSAHLREISLSILPQTVEDDEDDENDEEIDSDLGHLSVALAGPEELRHEHEEDLPKIEPGSPTQNQGLPRHEGPVQVPSSSLGNSASTQPVVEGKTPVDAPELEIDIDSIIDRLIKLKSLRSMPTHTELTEDEIKLLCTKAREIFLGQPSLLELVAPLKIIGDLRGQFDDLLRTFELSGFPPEANYVLLGNYVGLYLSTNSIETLCLIIAYKIKYPENFFPLRGNNEARTARTSSQLSAFFEECKIRYNVKIWELFVGVFDSMPLAAVVDDKIFCVQGGLSPDLHSIDQIKQIARPTDVPESGLLCDLLWSDADRDVVGWGEHERGISFTFGPDVVSHFLEKHEFDLIVRGHQVIEDGYEFFARRQFVTLFGATDYMREFNNKAAVMSVDENLLCSFNVLNPLQRKPPLKPRQRKPPLKPQSRVK